MYVFLCLDAGASSSELKPAETGSEENLQGLPGPNGGLKPVHGPHSERSPWRELIHVCVLTCG